MMHIMMHAQVQNMSMLATQFVRFLLNAVQSINYDPCAQCLHSFTSCQQGAKLVLTRLLCP